MRRRHSPDEDALLKRWRDEVETFARPGEPRRPVSRKTHPFDCGIPRCWTCHLHKLNGHEATRQEHAAELKLREHRHDAFGG